MPKPPKSGIRGVFQRRGVWYATWTDSTGKPEERTCASKGEAAIVAERGREQARVERLLPERREARERQQTTLTSVLDDLETIWQRKASGKDDDRFAKYWRGRLGNRPVTVLFGYLLVIDPAGKAGP